jgi:hypothetical protein
LHGKINFDQVCHLVISSSQPVLPCDGEYIALIFKTTHSNVKS